MSDSTIQEPKRIAVPPNYSLQTGMLIAFLKDHQGPVSDNDLTEACGRDTRPHGNGYSCLATAIKYLKREHAVCWVRMRGENKLVRADNERIDVLCLSRRRRANRTGKQALLELNCVNTSEMDFVARQQYIANVAYFGSIEILTRAVAQKKICAENVIRPVELPALIEAIRGRGNQE